MAEIDDEVLAVDESTETAEGGVAVFEVSEEDAAVGADVVVTKEEVDELLATLDEDEAPVAEMTE